MEGQIEARVSRLCYQADLRASVGLASGGVETGCWEIRLFSFTQCDEYTALIEEGELAEFLLESFSPSHLL